MDHHLDARDGDPVDSAQGDPFQESQCQPVDPHAVPATQGLEAEGQQGAALLPVGLQGQMLAREVGQLRREVGIWTPAHKQRGEVLVQPRWDSGEDGWALPVD